MNKKILTQGYTYKKNELTSLHEEQQHAEKSKEARETMKIHSTEIKGL